MKLTITKLLWLVPVMAVALVGFLVAVLVPPLLLAWALVAFIGCDPGVAILLGLAAGVPWSMLLPHLLD